MNEFILIRRRKWMLAASTALLSLPACSASDDAQRAKAGLPPLTPEQKRLKQKFKGLNGGQLVVDAFGEKEAVTILNEQGRVFYTSDTLSIRNQSVHSYGAEFGVPLTLRAMWRRQGEAVGGVVQNPIRGTERYGIYEGGTVVGDFTVTVAARIPDDLLEAMRKGVGGFRLKLRLHDDGLLVGWDLSRGFNLQYFAGGDFREADIENGKVLRKGWYIHPKTGQKIETDF